MLLSLELCFFDCLFLLKILGLKQELDNTSFFLIGWINVEFFDCAQVIYLPIMAERTIDYIQFHLVHQEGRLVDFRGKEIWLRVHIKALV